MDRDKLKMLSRIARECDMTPTHLSKIINQLKNHELVECINPEVNIGRLYRLTETGEKVSESLDLLKLD